MDKLGERFGRPLQGKVQIALRNVQNRRREESRDDRSKYHLRNKLRVKNK